MKKKYLMMVLLLMGIVIATTSCNKEEPEEIIEEEEEEIPDSEFNFFNDPEYLCAKPYKFIYYFRMDGFEIMNGTDYSSEFRVFDNPIKDENSFLKYNFMVKTFHSEEELLKSDFSKGYSYIIQNITPIDFSKQTYVIVCWICGNLNYPEIRPMEIYNKDNKYVIKYYKIGRGVQNAVEYTCLIYIIDDPQIEAKYIRVAGVFNDKN